MEDDYKMRETFSSTALQMTVPAEVDKPCQFYHEMKPKAGLLVLDLLE